MQQEKINPLGSEKISKLLLKFAIPSIIAMLVNALYNIVDQIYIGHIVGVLGNAATNVSFPLTTICTAIGLLFGVGGAAGFNLKLGAGDKDEAGKIAGSAIGMLAICGICLFAIVSIFLNQLMNVFGSSEQALPYALTYSGIIAFGFPFVILSTGMSTLIRADGKPMYSMVCVLVGAIINAILDPILMLGFDMGIAGASVATIISQIISCVVALLYLRKFQSIKLRKIYFKPRLKYIKLITSLGLASCFNQLAMTVVQITMNNTLTHYGELSKYGSDVPLACVGVISKVNIIFIALVVGLSQGSQPIIGFNYGARKYDRVKETYSLIIKIVMTMSIVAFLCFQFLPVQILNIFGNGDELYYEFGVKYFRIFMLMTFINGIQPLVANFLISIGKATTGILVSLTRQVLFLLPLILILPLWLGIDGVVYAGPIADMTSCIMAIYLIHREMKKISKLQMETIA